MTTSIANNTTTPPITGSFDVNVLLTGLGAPRTGSFDVNVLLTGLGAPRRTAPLEPLPPAKHVVLEGQVMV
jgi:hypothetical protein